jgi:parallel beta-helix repeat protein
MGQSLPHTFSANTAAKASEVNENFTYLLERFGTRKTTVNCYSGESITTALQNYNHIVISGVCTENISLDGETLPHRVVILEGSSSASDGITASSSASPVIDINYHVFVRVKNLTLKGGQMGLKVRRNGIALISNSIVENNSGHGICACGTSFMFSESNTIRNNSDNGIYATDNAEVNIKSNTISGHSGGSSITITQGAYAVINSNTITGSSGNTAVQIIRGSSAYIKSNTIQSAHNGISVKDSSHAILKNNSVSSNSQNGLLIKNNASAVLVEGNTFSNNNYGILLTLGGSLNMRCDEQLTSATTISGNTGGAIFLEKGGTAKLCNLTLNLSTPAMAVNTNSSLELSNSSLTSSSGRVIYSRGGAALDIDNTTITGNSSTEAVKLNDGSNLQIKGSTVSGGAKGISAVYNSIVRLQGGNTITGNTQAGINLLNSTLHQYSDAGTSTISSNGGSEIVAERSYLNLDNVTVTGTGGSTEVDLRYGSLLMLGSGSSVTGTVTCGNTASDNGSFVNNSGTSVTTSGC